jgi:hypothetical protein
MSLIHVTAYLRQSGPPPPPPMNGPHSASSLVTHPQRNNLLDFASRKHITDTKFLYPTLHPVDRSQRFEGP